MSHFFSRLAETKGQCALLSLPISVRNGTIGNSKVIVSSVMGSRVDIDSCHSTRQVESENNDTALPYVQHALGTKFSDLQ